jgi:hypothetical protein
VLNCNLERWSDLLGDLTYDTLFVPLTRDDAVQFLEAYYKDTEQRPDAVESAAAAYLIDAQTDLPPLNLQEAALRMSLGPSIQNAIDRLSRTYSPATEKQCFVKLSSRSPKDAAARSGVFKAFYKAAITRRGTEAFPDPNAKLRLLCEAESVGLRFSRSVDVIRALILSERVWQVTSFIYPCFIIYLIIAQDLTLALRYPKDWQQNIIIRSWEPVEIDMVRFILRRI